MFIIGLFPKVNSSIDSNAKKNPTKSEWFYNKIFPSLRYFISGLLNYFFPDLYLVYQASHEKWSFNSHTPPQIPFWFDLVRLTVGILLNFHYSICLIDEQIGNSSFIFLAKWLVTVKICFLSHAVGKWVMWSKTTTNVWQL